MSKISDNGKFMHLENVKVFYNKKTDNVEIISTDEDVIGKPFHVLIARGTGTDDTLREMLADLNIATQPKEIPLQISAQYFNPLEAVKNSDLITLGSAEHGEKIVWDVNEHPNLVLATNVLRAKYKTLHIINHCLHNGNSWNVKILSNNYEFPTPQKNGSYVYTEVSYTQTLKEAYDYLLSLKKDIQQGSKSIYSVSKNKEHIEKKTLLVLWDLGFFIKTYPDESIETKNLKREITDLLQYIIRIGRSTGIHFLATISNSAIEDFFKSGLQFLFSAKLVSERMTVSSSLMFIGSDTASRKNDSQYDLISIDGVEKKFLLDHTIVYGG